MLGVYNHCLEVCLVHKHTSDSVCLNHIKIRAEYVDPLEPKNTLKN